MSIALAFALIATILAVIELARSNLRGLLAWAVLLLALIFLLPGLR